LARGHQLSSLPVTRAGLEWTTLWLLNPLPGNAPAGSRHRPMRRHPPGWPRENGQALRGAGCTSGSGS